MITVSSVGWAAPGGSPGAEAPPTLLVEALRPYLRSLPAPVQQRAALFASMMPPTLTRVPDLLSAGSVHGLPADILDFLLYALCLADAVPRGARMRSAFGTGAEGEGALLGDWLATSLTSPFART
jgi:hypothetical protein